MMMLKRWGGSHTALEDAAGDGEPVQVGAADADAVQSEPKYCL